MLPRCSAIERSMAASSGRVPGATSGTRIGGVIARIATAIFG